MPDQKLGDLAAKFNEAATRRRATVDRLPSTEDASGWEAQHKRVTFYCPTELLDAVEAEMRRSGRSKTQVISDALREHLG